MRRSGWFRLGVVLAIFGLITTLAVMRDEPPAERSGPYAGLSLTVELDKNVYTRTERVSATVTVTSYGIMPAMDIVVDCEPNGDIATTFLAEGEDQISLDARGIGDGIVTPLESRIGTATGVVSPGAYNVGVLAVVCAVHASNTSLTTMFQTTAAVTGVSNEVTGRFTTCQIDRYDTGAAGIPLVLEGDHADAEGEPPTLSTVTDADGRFTFPAVPAGPYQLSYVPPAGYKSSHPDLGNHIQLLVTGDDVRWETSELSVTTTNPTTTCA